MRNKSKKQNSCKNRKDNRSILNFPIKNLQNSFEEKKGLNPEEQELIKVFKTFATNVWRMQKIILDIETKEPKEELGERAVAKLARYLESLNGALEDARIQTVGNYEGKTYSEGDAVKVLSFEERKDLVKDEYIETLIPTVRWIDNKGKHVLLQQAEVVVGRASTSNEKSELI